MSLVRFERVGRQFGERWTFRDLSFQISAGDRWGVVGRNGEGKTTLLRLIAGDDSPTEGEIWRLPRCTISLLRQEDAREGPVTVAEAALEPFSDLVALEAELERESRFLASADASDPEVHRRLVRYDEALERFRRRGGYEMRARAEAALEGLGFGPESWQREVRSLSGGEASRLRLVQALLAGPDLLLLDEPTNHLDLRSTEWLEDFLRSYPGTLVVVSHDRAFLDAIATRILHLEGGSGHTYVGGYQAFLEQREQRLELQRKEYEKQQAYIARTEEFIRRNIAGQKTKQAKSRRTLLARMERVAAPTEEVRSLAVRFHGVARSGSSVLRLEKVSCGYGGGRLFAPFDAEVSRGERIALIGPNGSGKSTLLKTIAGQRPADEGSIETGVGVRIAYYRQDFEHLRPDWSVEEQVAHAAPGLGTEELRAHLARFLFAGAAIETRVGDLSGGEKARVALAMVTLQGANLLLLDEPTNHLDIPAREALEEALDGFGGAIVFVSHDRAFLTALSTRVWAIEGVPSRPIRDYPGNFADWRASGWDLARTAQQTPPAGDGANGRGDPVSGSRTGGLSKNELRRREMEMERVEAEIAQVEEALSENAARLSNPSIYSDPADPELPRRLALEGDRLRGRLAELFERWERLGEEIAGATVESARETGVPIDRRTSSGQIGYS